MANNELWIYTTPKEAHVQLRLDNGTVLVGEGPQVANGRDDGHCMYLPQGTTGQGGVLEISHSGCLDFSNRGLIVPNESGPAHFVLDDVHLVTASAPPLPPIPERPDPNADPLAIINGVWATGQYELATKEGCGRFTEACCTELHARQSLQWGHIAKKEGQNQYNGHAVDALYLLHPAGSTTVGVYDIIHDSESSNASPCFNWKDAGDPALWYYPA
jgi:hypothetical protein